MPYEMLWGNADSAVGWFVLALFLAVLCTRQAAVGTVLRRMFHVASLLFTMKTALKGVMLHLLSSSLPSLPLR